ncbi:MAG: mannonate dehydratase [Clostridia bacterium]|nr:mannonate dehydratase [Clostridia bacterium]MBR3714337.1 mannonate dehydratase [Clostridia bacterium]
MILTDYLLSEHDISWDFAKQCGVDVPIRVDHVPLMAGEDNTTPGYTALGRLFAIGYLKGILDAEK